MIKGGKDHSALAGSGLSSQHLHLTAGWKHHGSPPPPQLCAPTAHPSPSGLEGPSSLLASLCTPPWEPPPHRAAGPGGMGQGLVPPSSSGTAAAQGSAFGHDALVLHSLLHALEGKRRSEIRLYGEPDS